MGLAQPEQLSVDHAADAEIVHAPLGSDVGLPVISVIVPVRNNPQELRMCLDRLSASTFPRYEVIVVDDASTDDTAKIAGELGALVVSRGRCQGPASARNRGAEFARGEYLFFLDSDVCVHPDTLQELSDTFAHEPHLDAVFGSYDSQPSAANVLSQYKNLFHHFVHQDGREQATTFWSGCGAVRRSVFLELGGFSGSYKRPSIEDIELGMRLHHAGHQIKLNKRIQVTHLKRWTLWSIIKTDVLDRGIPWTELMLRAGSMPNDLNTKVSQRISVVLAYGLLITFGFGVWYYRHLVWVPLLLLILISLLDYWSVQRRFPTAVRLLGALFRAGHPGDGRLYLEDLAPPLARPDRGDRGHQLPVLLVLLEQRPPLAGPAVDPVAPAVLSLLRGGIWPGPAPPRAQSSPRTSCWGTGVSRKLNRAGRAGSVSFAHE